MHRRDLLTGSAAFLFFADAASSERLSDDAAAARRYDTERRFIDTPFGRIAHIDRGTGPAALFLHGFPLNSFQWRGAIERLSADRRCLAPDFLGLGYTQVAPGQAVTPAAQVAMLAAFLDKLGVAQVDVIASDSGGAVAQLFLVAYPARVRTVLLTNCDTEIDSPPPALLPVLEMAKDGTYPDRWLAPWLQDKALARSAKGLGGMCFTNPDHPSDAAIDQYLAPLVSSRERKALVNHYALGLTPKPLAGISARLSRLTTPVAVVWGMSDTIFSSDSPDYLSGTLPGLCRVREIAGAKLFFPEEYPDIIAEEARALWARARSNAG